MSAKTPRAPSRGHFPEHIAEFARVLRRAGMPVGPGAVIEAVTAVETAGLERRADFYWALHAVLVKRHEHDAIFNEAFRLFWRRRHGFEHIMDAMLPVAPEPAKARAAQRRVEEAMTPSALEPREIRKQEVQINMSGTMSDLEVLQKKDFGQMSVEEIAIARRVIETIAFADDETRRRRLVPNSRGHRIDMRRTLRASLRTGGAIINLKRRAPGHRKPPIVALLDISGSMSEYSRVCLHFLHALTEARGHVATFLFGTRLTNVTRALKTRDPDEALASCAGTAQDWSGGTRIGLALHEFNKRWLRRVLSQGAIVLLITDGLEREGTERLGFELDRLHRSCRRLIWLNPLLRYDAFEARAKGILAMLAHVDEVRPVHNLASLEALAAALAHDRPSAHIDPRRWLNRAA
jgi:uncharacterized protein with von Willebrand factor type A (vWA) domain